MKQDKLLQLKIAKAEALEKELIRKQELPHLYGYNWYEWALDFFESKNKMCLLTAANQISKSSTQIRKIIHWATETSLWEELWNSTPRQFWICYPDSNLATSEFEMKWVPEFMPRGSMKDDPKYGWKAYYKQAKKIDYVQFKSGVRLYFKTYEQDVHALQGSTVHYIGCDEELPAELYSELQFRLAASNGYFSMVFTATKAQEFWREAMEEIGTPFERFVGAWKRSVSLYECLHYKDGSKSHWTTQRIEQIEAGCKDENEVQRRVMGRFVRSDNRKFVFEKKSNALQLTPDDWREKPPKDWHIFVGIDVGSGKEGNSKSAIVFTAVKPDFRFARVFKAWRGDGIITTAGDVFEKYLEMKNGLDVFAVYYDYAAVDLHTIAERAAEPMIRAQKNNEVGEDILNTMFKFQMLYVDDSGDYELQKLMNELVSLGKDSTSGDDLCFSGDTKIFTATGDKNISDVSVGEYVFTRNGLKRVVAKTMAMSYVVPIHTERGITWVTGKHSYILENMLIKAEEITHNTGLGLTEKEKQRLLSSAGLNIEDIQRVRKGTLEIIFGQVVTIVVSAVVFIGIFIDYVMVVLKKVMQYIIQTTTQVTMIRAIYKKFTEAIIHRYTQKSQSVLKKLGKILKIIDIWQMLGMVQKRLLKYTAELVNYPGKKENLQISQIVRYVETILRVRYPTLNSALINARQKLDVFLASIISRKIVFTAEKFLQIASTQKSQAVLSYAQLKRGLEKPKVSIVYNITVEDEHEYFADSILVANCDALRYSVARVPVDWLKISERINSVVDAGNKKLVDAGVLARRAIRYADEKPNIDLSITSEFNEWNDLLE